MILRRPVTTRKFDFVAKKSRFLSYTKLVSPFYNSMPVYVVGLVELYIFHNLIVLLEVLVILIVVPRLIAAN
jgi:hypothetical protein